ncbi:MAG: UDP-N-acetylmuramate--L-alanine ligase [Chlamydiae bacterium RIFCSPHIGHO2_12_FULL_49_9]|nr:MAG: UDP-N-acetylmuramate--L-alanine ligase [Chlamydiae bacterium RIFCSPHIGHO2_12_FULL_49_9]
MKAKTFHFVGLGGIGMSALARVLLQKGDKVQGSDAQPSPLLADLQKEGAAVQIGHNVDALKEEMTIVYSSAVKESNVEMKRAKELKLPLLHRSDLLHFLMEGKKALLVTGTHGKTTTTALLSEVFLKAKKNPSFVVGGILASEKTNGKFGSGDYFIAEADESDGSFLKTAAFGAIVTNLEKDHLDYWKTEERLQKAFASFFEQALEEKHLFWCSDDLSLKALSPKGFSYGFSKEADLQISNLQHTDLGIVFDIDFQGKKYRQVELSLMGRHNALNASAVFGLSITLGVEEEAIREALRSFRGTARRLEFKGEVKRALFYDDYAHHPTEIKATLSALRARVKERRLVAIFQPHRNTRVQDLFDEFGDSFQDADEVILTDIYTAGEAPIEGITSASLFLKMKEKLKSKLYFIPRNELEKGVLEQIRPLDAVIALGAGDIAKAIDPIIGSFREKNPKLTLAVLFGGTSVEHEVSLLSAQNIINALDPSLYNVRLFPITKEGRWGTGEEGSKFRGPVLEELYQCDVCIPVLHGPEGEDGMVQGLLDTLGIPYVGCNYQSAAICMEKVWSKEVSLLHGVPTPAYVDCDKASYRRDPGAFIEKVEEKIGYPVWIKPVHLGSSIGVSKAAFRAQMEEGIEAAFLYDDRILAEKNIEGRQIEFAVMGNSFIRTARACEILNEGAFYDYEKKYGSQASGVRIPAALSPLEEAIGVELAERVYCSLGCRGLARVDFFLDHEGYYWFNEINPFPGFTKMSGYPKMWEASGLTLSHLLDELIVLALERSRSLVLMRGS